MGTAVNVQQMVFGNTGRTTRARVLRSRAIRRPASRTPTASSSKTLRARTSSRASARGLPLDELARLEPRGLRAAGRGDGAAGAPLRRHAGSRVHRRSRSALHAADPQRQARPTGRAADRGGHGLGGRDRPRRRRRPRRRQPARARAAADGQPPRRAPGDRHRPSGVRRRGGRAGRVRRRHRGRAGRRRRVGGPGARRDVGRRRPRDGARGRRGHQPRRDDLACGGRRPRLGHAVRGRRRGDRDRRSTARCSGSPATRCARATWSPSRSTTRWAA